MLDECHPVHGDIVLLILVIILCLGMSQVTFFFKKLHIFSLLQLNLSLFKSFLLFPTSVLEQ